MQEILQRIVDRTPGAQGAILMGFDGIPVLQAEAPSPKVDIEAVAMEFSFRFIELVKAAEALELGTIHDVTIKTDAGVVIARVLSEDYFACVFLDDPAYLGKGRYVLRVESVELAAQL
ncbi:MAG: hypothetical protein D6705_00735 [Deltaproteobacteria bacterium]|nr:MAG: hypothetical protein D6705_00735 [Deltaproteobacteria bacterium]